MTIRLADARDFDGILAVGQRFHEGSPYRHLFSLNATSCRRTLEWLLNNKGAIFVAETDYGEIVGMIAGLVNPNFASGELTCGEAFWWVDKDRRGCGVRLLRALEAWAREQGATQMQLIAPDGRAEQLYTRLGFRRYEAVYQRTLTR